MLSEMALCDGLFHTATGTAFADILVNDHRETWPIRSKRIRGWLRRCYYQATGEAASAAAIRSALDHKSSITGADDADGADANAAVRFG